MNESCSERVYEGRGGSHMCMRKGVVDREGKLWCKQHDPVVVKERRDASYAAYTKRMNAEMRRDESKAWGSYVLRTLAPDLPPKEAADAIIALVQPLLADGVVLS